MLLPHFSVPVERLRCKRFGLRFDPVKIGEAFRKFGIGDTTKDLLVVKISTSPPLDFEGVGEHLRSSIRGFPVDVNDENLRSVSDTLKIKKAYKLATTALSKSGGKSDLQHVNGEIESIGKHEKRRHMETSVLGAVALRGAT